MSAERIAATGLYDARYEHDACGVGFIATATGKPTRAIVDQALIGLSNLRHRGAVAADGRSGDGAGIMTQLPCALLQREMEARHWIADPDRLAVGMIFLPRDVHKRDRCIALIDQQVSRGGLRVVGWRDVPVEPGALGQRAMNTRPEIKQVIVTRPVDLEEDEFERRLLLTRKRIHNTASASGEPSLYVVSLSSRTIVYKGLLAAPQLAEFYVDLSDPMYESAIAVFHQRFSTNTFPSWKLAQPLRFLAHNGEINTIQGNIARFNAYAAERSSQVWKDQLRELEPIIEPEVSDSAALDNVFELLTLSGRHPLSTMMMLVPDAYQQNESMPRDLYAFYEYHAAIMAPWDVAAALDRNGLRPMRYWITEDDLVIAASETGVTKIPFERVVESGRLGPGQLIAVDTIGRRIIRDEQIKRDAAGRRPYADWVDKQIIQRASRSVGEACHRLPEQFPDLVRMQKAFCYGLEDVERILESMVYTGKEPVGSMGDDTPIAVLSHQPKSIYRYFKQIFAQVTNPPIDSLRERLVMSRRIALGWRSCVMDEYEYGTGLVKFPTPIVTTDEFEWLINIGDWRLTHGWVDCVFPAAHGPGAMEVALQRICTRALELVESGRTLIVLSDRNVCPENARVPMMLATAAVHHHLIAAGKRSYCSLICDTGDLRDAHHFACLIGYGAALIHPYLALAGVSDVVGRDPRSADITLEQGIANYRQAVEEGVLKIMAKRGISTINSYRGAMVFEAIGISSDVIEKYFTGTVSRIGGVGLCALARDILYFHARAYGEEQGLSDLGIYHYRKDGEYHAANPTINKLLHRAVRNSDQEAYDRYVQMVEDRPPCQLRDLLEWREDENGIPLDEVEPAEEIVTRFCSQAMSLGAISPEAHEMLAVAMNRIGAKSNSGEGGESPSRYYTDGDSVPNPRLCVWQPHTGDFGNSSIKQVASGRFGVTPEYLVSAGEIEIKMAQGAKPGEGGQIAGAKVADHIAALRNAAEGSTLISPPPHHDIYSIEDLSQLIYDLKRINPAARIGVKLVSVAGVGTIASGVVKSYADCVQISGFDGGTGASSLSSIKHAGLPWELGLAEVQQTLVKNDLRGRVTVRVDGGMRTGRDIIIAALLGADEFGFGTLALVAAGCVMVRQCHLNNCPVGIATQREDLRRKFPGQPEHVIALMLFIAEQTRMILARMGFHRLEEIIGRVALLRPRSDVRLPKAPHIDLAPVLMDPDPAGTRARRRTQHRNERPEESPPLDEIVWRDCMPAVVGRTAVRKSFHITNRDRSVGVRLSGAIASHTRARGLADGGIDLRFTGVAGQSFGAFCNRGMTMVLEGEAQDGVGKGMSGGRIVVRQPRLAGRRPLDNPVVVGNAVMYGATGGELYAAGRAGERFCIRNSGAWAVIEGCGDHGCEYMTNGIVAVLGGIGRNFGAGMTGGIAYVLAGDAEAQHRFNNNSVEIGMLCPDGDEPLLLALLERHRALTGSDRAENLLAAWVCNVADFWVVTPRDPDGQRINQATHIKRQVLRSLKHENHLNLAG